MVQEVGGFPRRAALAAAGARPQQRHQGPGGCQSSAWIQQHRPPVGRCCAQELKLLDDDATVYKLIGPAMIKQDLVEAKANVGKRLEYITGELKRVSDRISTLEGKAREQQAAVRGRQLQTDQRRGRPRGSSPCSSASSSSGRAGPQWLDAHARGVSTHAHQQHNASHGVNTACCCRRCCRS